MNERIKVAELEAELMMRREQAEGLQNQWVKDTQKIVALEAEVKMLRKDAERYRWLRDKSVPWNNFYLSVPIEFKDETYSKAEVDASIDAAREGK